MNRRSHTQVLVRMRDAALALSAAANHRLARIELQKSVYLADVLLILFDLTTPVDGHETYKHGPYDVALQSAVDCLAFRGLVNISAQKQSASETQCRYTLTAPGRAWATQLESDYPARAMSHLLVVRNVGRLGWARIVRLTYAEPMFLATRHRGFGQRLDHQSVRMLTSSRFLLEYVQRALGTNRRDPGVVARAFFDYLDAYDRANP